MYGEQFENIIRRSARSCTEAGNSAERKDLTVMCANGLANNVKICFTIHTYSTEDKS